MNAKTLCIIGAAILLAVSAATAQEVLPKPEEAFRDAKIGHTYKDSTPVTISLTKAPVGAPINYRMAPKRPCAELGPHHRASHSFSLVNCASAAPLGYSSGNCRGSRVTPPHCRLKENQTHPECRRTVQRDVRPPLHLAWRYSIVKLSHGSALSGSSKSFSERHAPVGLQFDAVPNSRVES
jgi:hypothetical protein